MPPVLFSVIESPGHPNLSDLYRRLGIQEERLGSQRKAIQALKHLTPDFVVAEFFYGFGNNYAGANLSNLDTLLASLQRYAPKARVIVVVDKAQRPHADKLAELFPLHAILVRPVHPADIEPLLNLEEAVVRK